MGWSWDPLQGTWSWWICSLSQAILRLLLLPLLHQIFVLLEVMKITDEDLAWSSKISSFMNVRCDYIYISWCVFERCDYKPYEILVFWGEIQKRMGGYGRCLSEHHTKNPPERFYELRAGFWALLRRHGGPALGLPFIDHMPMSANFRPNTPTGP